MHRTIEDWNVQNVGKKNLLMCGLPVIVKQPLGPKQQNHIAAQSG